MKRSLILPPLFLLLVVVIAWEMLSGLDLISAVLLPAPSVVVKALWQNHEDLLGAFLETSTNTLLGFLISILVGTALAFSFSLSRVLRNAFLPFAVFFQTVPIIAIAPLLVIYFGFGSPTVIAASFIVSVFPIIANTLLGLEQADSDLEELFNLYQASAWQKLWGLKFPFAVPGIFAGLKVAAGLAIIGAVAGEFVAGGGLGAVIDSARTQQRVDLVFAALLLLALLGMLLIGVLTVGYRMINSWRPFARSLS